MSARGLICPLVSELGEAVDGRQVCDVRIEELDEELATRTEVGVGVFERCQLVVGGGEVHECVAGTKDKGEVAAGKGEGAQVAFKQVNAGGEAGGGQLVLGEGEEGWAEIDTGDRVTSGSQGGKDASGAAAELEEGVAGFFGDKADKLDVARIVA